jgi:hypothetical protein
LLLRESLGGQQQDAAGSELAQVVQLVSGQFKCASEFPRLPCVGEQLRRGIAVGIPRVGGTEPDKRVRVASWRALLILCLSLQAFNCTYVAPAYNQDDP